MDKGRMRKALAIGGGVVIVGAGLTWFAVLPHVIENKVNSALEEVSEKTGRTVEISDLRLSGLASAHVGRMTVSDKGRSSSVGISLADVTVSLSGLPIGGDFHVKSIEVDEANVSFRVVDGKTNFDDILDSLKSSEPKDETDKKPKKPAKWKKYLTPMPNIRVQNASVTMEPLKARENLDLGAIALNDVEISPIEDASEMMQFDVEGRVSALLIESGTPTTYESTISGQILGSKEGFVAVSYPKSEKGRTPSIFDEGDVHIAFDDARFVLPTTFELTSLKITQNENTLIGAEKARARLMALPPKKVSGVYFKEVELTKPEIHDYLRGGTTAITQWLKALKNAWIKPKTETESGSDDAPKKAKNPKDYFFSQRMFVTDGHIIVEDQRELPMVNVELSDIQLEVGYRSIRKIVDYRLGFNLVEPVMSSLKVGGVYEMRDEEVSGMLDISSLRAGESLKKFQVNLREPRKDDGMVGKALNAGLEAKNVIDKAKADNLKADDVMRAAKAAADFIDSNNEDFGGFFAHKLIPAIDFNDASLSLHLGYDYGFKSKKLALKGDLETSGGLWQSDALSKEPLALNAKLSAEASGDLNIPSFQLDSVKLSTGGGEIALGLGFEKAQRPSKPKAQNGESPDAWKFRLSAELAPSPMQDLFESIPHALRTEIDGLEWTGSLGFKFEASGFLDEISAVEHKFDLITSDDFGVKQWPAQRNIQALNDGFTYHVNDPNAQTPHDIVIPPSVYPIVKNDVTVFAPRIDEDSVRSSYPEWVLFDDINPWLIQLITTTEDGAFFTHHGFSPMQIKSALERNISRNSFSRGASTISMQLVKNLFFERTKTLSRKFQEVIYTWLMESVVQIPKKRIMELYFNIIEFGPEIYGIEEAAKYYFGKRSNALSLKECAFLMAIIPKPRRGIAHRSKPVLDQSLQKTMNFFIREMYRRKCDPKNLASMRARYAKRGLPVPFEPCCPPQDSLQLMLDADTMEFYVPDTNNPQQYGYRPDLYTADGQPLTQVRAQRCGYHGDLDTMDSIDSADTNSAIFNTMPADQLPTKADVGL